MDYFKLRLLVEACEVTVVYIRIDFHYSEMNRTKAAFSLVFKNHY